MNEKDISPIIHNLLKTAHISRGIKEDLFQDLYLYHLQLAKRYKPERGVPLEAFLIKFLKWRMWALIKLEYEKTTPIAENIPDYREEDIVDVDLITEGMSKVIDEDKTLLILRHALGKSYQKLSQITGLSIEGVRKKLKKLEAQIKWESIDKATVKKDK